MLLPLELMQALSPLTAATPVSSGFSNPGSQQQPDYSVKGWLMAADDAADGERPRFQIIMDFLANNTDGELASAFASNLGELLTESSHTLSAGNVLSQALARLQMPAELDAAWSPAETSADEADVPVMTWSIEEILEFSETAMQSGNSLPLTDDSLPPELLLMSLLAGNLTEPSTVTELTDASDTLQILNPGHALSDSQGATDARLGDAGLSVASLVDASAASIPEQVTNPGDDAVVPVNNPATPLRDPQQTGRPGDKHIAAGSDTGAGVGASRSADSAISTAANTQVAVPAAAFTARPNLVQSGADGLDSAPGSQLPTAQLSSAAQASALIAELNAGGYRNDQRTLAAEAVVSNQAAATRTTESLPRLNLEASFGQHTWPDSVGRQLMVMNARGMSAAMIQLDPPELGSLMVKIQVSAEQQTTVNFVSPHAVVREALEQQSVRLQELLREQGLDLVNVSVSDQSSREGGDSQQRSERGAAGEVMEQSDAELPITAQASSLIDFYV